MRRRGRSRPPSATSWWTQLIATEIEQLNARLARVEQVKRFRILPKELVPEDGDTTPTRKVKRTHAYKLFGDLVEEMLAEDSRTELVGARLSV